MSKLTSTCGTPRGACGMPSKINLPKVLLSCAMGRSPCKTWISTLVWLSAAVENICDLEVGIVVFLSIKGVATPPKVSMPKVKGVTSNSKTSLTSPCRTPACTAAPTATTSSGLTFKFGSLPKNSLTFCCTKGMRVIPPTSNTSSISLAVKPASFKAAWQGPIVFSTRPPTNSSNFARNIFITKCLGPLASVVIKGWLISVSMVVDSSILAFSAASFILCKANVSLDKSMP